MIAQVWPIRTLVLIFVLLLGPSWSGRDVVGQAEQGNSVALSADGNTAIVGGRNDNSGTGAAWVYTRSGGVWTGAHDGSVAVRGERDGGTFAADQLVALRRVGVATENGCVVSASESYTFTVSANMTLIADFK
jgi:hypothetical protein